MENALKITKFKSYITLGIFSSVIIYLIIASPGFLRFDNLMNVIVSATFVAIPAMGLGTIMLSGSFDLSFVGIIGVVSVTSIRMVHAEIAIPVVLVTALAIALGFELANAFLIIKLKIHPWLTTISTMLAALGLEKAISKAYFLTTSHSFFQTIRFESFLGIPLPVWILGLSFLLMYLLVHKTAFGMHLYAVGGNEVAARKAGLKVERLRFSSFAAMGVCIWIVSLVYLSQLSGYTPEAAYTNLNEVILSVFFGMSISRKNVITIPGAVVGALFVALLANGLALSGVSSYWIKLIEGCLVIVVVITNAMGSGEIVQLEK